MPLTSANRFAFDFNAVAPVFPQPGRGSSSKSVSFGLKNANNVNRIKNDKEIRLSNK